MQPSSQLIAKTFNRINGCVNRNGEKLDQLIASRNNRQETTPRSRSFNSTQSSRSSFSTPPPGSRRSINDYRMRIADGSRVVVKLEKELLFKKIFTISGPFGRLFRDLEEISALETVSTTPSSAQPICRIGRNVTFLTSEITLSLNRNISSERLWCFRTDGITRPIDLKMPLIPVAIKHVKTVNQLVVTTPYAILFHRKIDHNKKRTTVVETIEIRSIGALGEAEIEVFAEPKDLKVEKLGYSERIFIGNGVLRVVTEASLLRESVRFTEVTRHFWRCDLHQTEPVLTTAKEDLALTSSIKVGSLTDTSAGSPSPSSPRSPESRMSVMEPRAQATPLTTAREPSKVQEILRRRREFRRENG